MKLGERIRQKNMKLLDAKDRTGQYKLTKTETKDLADWRKEQLKIK